MPLLREVMNNYDADELKQKVRRIADELAFEHQLNLGTIEWIKNDSFYGQCSISGNLKIKVEFFDGELVPEMEVWRTLAHELAHLKHFNHNREFWEFNKILAEEISVKLGRKIRPEVAFFLREGKVIY